MLNPTADHPHNHHPAGAGTDRRNPPLLPARHPSSARRRLSKPPRASTRYNALQIHFTSRFVS
ncbi:MAG: hypothetical protein GX885_11535 [Methanomicrobiales archaeon]|nr:hypothetical protein [Methanomicrobiales archaeon]